MQSFCRGSFIFFICTALFLPETGFSRFRRNTGVPFIKGFNPCGWNTCRPAGSRFVRRPFFQRRFSRGGGGCSSGGCGVQRIQGSQGRHGGGCSSGNCGNGGGGFPGGGQSAPRPVQDTPVPNQQPAIDPTPNQRDLAQNGEGDLDRAPSLDEEGDLEEAPSLHEESADSSGAENLEGAKIFEQRCQGCHESAKEDADIGGVASWGKEEWERAIAAVEGGSMPQKSELSEEDKKILLAFLKEKAGLNKEETPESGERNESDGGTEQASAQPPSQPAPQPGSQAGSGSSAGSSSQASNQAASGQTPHSGSSAGASSGAATPPSQKPAQAAAGSESSWLKRDAILGNWRDRVRELANPFLDTAEVEDSKPDTEPQSKKEPESKRAEKKEPEKKQEDTRAQDTKAMENPDNEFTLGVKEALSGTTGFQQVLESARSRSAEGVLLEAIRQEKSLSENSSPGEQAKLNRWEAQIEVQLELGALSQKTQAELLSERAQADIRDVPESTGIKNRVRRELIEQELTRRQEARQSEVRQQNIQRMQAVQAQKQVQKTQDDLRKAMRELQKANRALGKPRLRGLKKNQKELDAAAIRKAKAKAMERAINENKGVVPALQDPKAILSTPSPVYRVLQAGQNIEELIQAYEKALGELNSLRK